jgi:putative hydrolase of the HAD superfamily
MQEKHDAKNQNEDGMRAKGVAIGKSALSANLSPSKLAIPMIKNVIFDVGNVFVCWSPPVIVERLFALPSGTDANQKRVELLFGGAIWRQLNLGQITQAEAEIAYQTQHGFSAEETHEFFLHVVDHQDLIEGTAVIARRLKDAGYRLFGLTDNVQEIVSHLQRRYQFWKLFEGVVVSADIGLMKPAPEIFRHVLERFDLAAAETVFFDDYPPNIAGARSVGIAARLFTTPERCEADLLTLDMAF